MYIIPYVETNLVISYHVIIYLDRGVLFMFIEVA